MDGGEGGGVGYSYMSYIPCSCRESNSRELGLPWVGRDECAKGVASMERVGNGKT